MNRRGFLSLLAAAFASPVLAHLPSPAPAPLAFHPEAFAFVMEPITAAAFEARYIIPACKAIADKWDAAAADEIYRQVYP